MKNKMRINYENKVNKLFKEKSIIIHILYA